jgi:hypothetical protein
VRFLFLAFRRDDEFKYLSLALAWGNKWLKNGGKNAHKAKKKKKRERALRIISIIAHKEEEEEQKKEPLSGFALCSLVFASLA